jgi:hypothetical protein
MVNKKDLAIIRDLAKKQMELAKSPAMDTLRNEWRSHGRFEAGSRPMIMMELWTFRDEIIPPLMRCEGEQARRLEGELLSNTVNHELFGDDTVVRDYIPVRLYSYFKPFNIEVKAEHATMQNGETSLGHHFIPSIHDLERDFHKLGKSTFGINSEATQKEMDWKNEMIGDIIPVRQSAFSLYSCLSQHIVHIMDMETMFMSMYDYPDLFHKMMDMVTSDTIAMFDLLEAEGVLRATAEDCVLSQGSYCYTDELYSDGTGLRTNEIWGYMDSQESAGLSPDMFMEFFAPYYRRIIDRYGLLSYGCCEAVDSIWDCFLSKLGNLRKLSVSAWSDEAYIGEKLNGRNIVYMRKPTPNLLSIGAVLDEDEVKKDITKTITAAKNCRLEIIQRDVYKINGTYEKVRRYVELIRQCVMG